MLHLSNGSPCPGEDNLYGSSSIRFRCDASVYGAGGVLYFSMWDAVIDVSSRQTGGNIPISGRRQSSLPIHG
jgi:cation-dependent mannose-6-phosphate receptor